MSDEVKNLRIETSFLSPTLTSLSSLSSTEHCPHPGIFVSFSSPSSPCSSSSFSTSESSTTLALPRSKGELQRLTFYRDHSLEPFQMTEYILRFSFQDLVRSGAGVESWTCFWFSSASSSPSSAATLRGDLHSDEVADCQCFIHQHKSVSISLQCVYVCTY